MLSPNVMNPSYMLAIAIILKMSPHIALYNLNFPVFMILLERMHEITLTALTIPLLTVQRIPWVHLWCPLLDNYRIIYSHGLGLFHLTYFIMIQCLLFIWSSLNVWEVGECLGLELRQLFSQQLDLFGLFLGLIEELPVGTDLLELGFIFVLACTIFSVHLLNLLALFDSTL